MAGPEFTASGETRPTFIQLNDTYRVGAAEANCLEQQRRAIRDLEAEGVDVSIGLTHLHLADDVDLAGLKPEHPKLAFIGGGHEHDPQYAAATPATAAVVKGASNAQLIWHIDLTQCCEKATATDRVTRANRRFAAGAVFAGPCVSRDSPGGSGAGLLPLRILTEKQLLG